MQSEEQEEVKQQDQQEEVKSQEQQQQQPQEQQQQQQQGLEGMTEDEIFKLATLSVLRPEQMKLIMEYFQKKAAEQQSGNYVPSTNTNANTNSNSNYRSNAYYNQAHVHTFQEINDDYGDDELTENAIQSKMGIDDFKYSLSDNLELDIRCRFKKATVKPTEKLFMPGMITIRTNDLDYEQLLKHHEHLQTLGRQTVDLVCLIDKSGSMEGKKIELVKNTLKKILNLMSPMDRICIVCFNSQGFRSNTFTRVSDENKQRLNELIDSIQAEGGTCISEGINHALHAIKSRKFKNNVTSILLLSDGQDSSAYLGAKACIDKYNIDDAFQIETIGFGEDHDPKLLRKISDLRNGSFNFMQNIDFLDSAFVNIFAGLISTVAQNIKVVVNFTPLESVLKNFRVSKTFGDNWKKISETQYEIHLLSILSGVSKDFVFEIEADPYDEEAENLLNDENSTFKFISAELTAQSVSQNEEAKKEKSFTLQMVSGKKMMEVEGQQEDNDEDGEVVENYYRVLSAETIQEGQNEAEKGNFDQANDSIQKTMEILKSSKYSNSQNVQSYLTELNNCKNLCNSSQFNKIGQGVFSSNAQSLLNQISSSSSHSGSKAMKMMMNYSNNMQKIFGSKYTN